MLGIIGAMESETSALCAMLENTEERTIGKIKYTKGEIYGKEIVVAQCFDGKVNAAMATQTMILVYNVNAVINIGVGGGLLDEMQVCDIAIASQVVEHDYDLTPLGYDAGFVLNVDKVYIPCSENLCNKLTYYAKQLEDTNVFTGVIVSGDQFISSNEKQKQLNRDFGAICTEMEGASIGHVCYLNGVDFCVLRAISDKADDDSKIDFRTFVEKACGKTLAILTALIKDMD